MSLPGAAAIGGFIDELTNRFGRDHVVALDQIESTADAEIEALLRPLSKEDLEDLLATIRARRGLLSVGAAYGNEVVATAKQILAFGGAGIGLAAAFLQKLTEVPPLILKCVAVVGLFYGNLILLSLYIIFSFAWQARFRYPFLSSAESGTLFRSSTTRRSLRIRRDRCFRADRRRRPAPGSTRKTLSSLSVITLPTFG